MTNQSTNQITNEPYTNSQLDNLQITLWINSATSQLINQPPNQLSNRSNNRQSLVLSGGVDVIILFSSVAQRWMFFDLPTCFLFAGTLRGVGNFLNWKVKMRNSKKSKFRFTNIGIPKFNFHGCRVHLSNSPNSYFETEKSHNFKSSESKH